MHLATSSYFRAHNKGGDHVIQSAVAKNSMLRAHLRLYVL